MKKILLTCFMLVFVLNAWAQDRTVSGTVTDAETGETLPGVNVLLKGTGTGITTDLDGNYKLSVPSDGGTLVFTFIGMATQEVEVGARSVINVSMQTDVAQLSEVVVVGYGKQSKVLSTQSISKVGADSFDKMPILSAQDALQGQAAGVQITGSSGVAGSQQNIRIRGVSSLTAGGSPLFVVDGVPLNDGSSANMSGTAGAPAPLNPLTELNPNEIESINILKDAAAVAIYGSRGANGVILIETKSGKSGKTKVDVNYYQGVSEPTVERGYMSREQYNEWGPKYVDQWGAFGVPPGVLPYGDLVDAVFGYDIDQGFDWPDAIIQGGGMQNANISASGGSDNTQFYVSGTYFTQDAYTIGNELERMNGRLNVTHQASDKLRFGVNLGLAQTENDRIDADNSTFAPMTSAFLQLPYFLPRTEEGGFRRGGFIPNILALEETSTFNLISRRTTGNAYAELDIIDNLTLKTDFGIDQYQTEETTRYADIVSPGGSASRQIRQDYKWLNTTTISYDDTFAGDHNISILGGYTYEQSNFNSVGAGGVGFVSDDFPNVASAAEPNFTTSTFTGWRLNSFFGRATYNYNNRYLAEASVRRDGSSRFGRENRFGVFWAAAAGWILSEEAFLKGVDQISLLKLRASIGTAGNDRIGNFPSLGLYGGGNLGNYAGSPGIYPTNAANPLLGWEETRQIDITMNLGLFNNRIDLEASYFDKLTTDLLLDEPLPFTSGFASRSVNAGSMSNKGIDFNLTTINVDAGGFQWRTNLNFGYLKNEIIALPNTNKDSEGRDFISESASQRALQGYSANTFYLVRYNGINPETGDAEWLTADGEPTTSPSIANDRVIVGSAIPRFNGGFTNTFTYKGFELSAFFTFVEGNFVKYDDLYFMQDPTNTATFNLDPRLLDTWEQPGDQSFAPAITSNTMNGANGAAVFGALNSTQQLISGDYVRLRNLSLTYNLPKSLLERTNVFRTARVYVQGQNLLTLFSPAFEEGLDPETNDAGTSNNLTQGESFFTSPQARTITGGVSFGF